MSTVAELKFVFGTHFCNFLRNKWSIKARTFCHSVLCCFWLICLQSVTGWQNIFYVNNSISDWLDTAMSRLGQEQMSQTNFSVVYIGYFTTKHSDQINPVHVICNIQSRALFQYRVVIVCRSLFSYSRFKKTYVKQSLTIKS